mgnify:CR=1 FL=1
MSAPARPPPYADHPPPYVPYVPVKSAEEAARTVGQRRIRQAEAKCKNIGFDDIKDKKSFRDALESADKHKKKELINCNNEHPGGPKFDEVDPSDIKEVKKRSLLDWLLIIGLGVCILILVVLVFDTFGEYNIMGDDPDNLVRDSGGVFSDTGPGIGNVFDAGNKSKESNKDLNIFPGLFDEPLVLYERGSQRNSEENKDELDNITLSIKNLEEEISTKTEKERICEKYNDQIEKLNNEYNKKNMEENREEYDNYISEFKKIGDECGSKNECMLNDKGIIDSNKCVNTDNELNCQTDYFYNLAYKNVDINPEDEDMDEETIETNRFNMMCPQPNCSMVSTGNTVKYDKIPEGYDILNTNMETSWVNFLNNTGKEVYNDSTIYDYKYKICLTNDEKQLEETIGKVDDGSNKSSRTLEDLEKELSGLKQNKENYIKNKPYQILFG